MPQTSSLRPPVLMNSSPSHEKRDIGNERSEAPQVSRRVRPFHRDLAGFRCHKVAHPSSTTATFGSQQNHVFHDPDKLDFE